MTACGPRILVSQSPGEIRIAVSDGRLRDYALWRPGRPDGVGDLHWARITRRARALSGSFVALAGHALHGFLPDSEGGGAEEGTRLVVRLTRAAQHGKGPRVSLHAADADAPAPGDDGQTRLLRRGADPLTRMAALYPLAPIELDDAHVMAGLAAALRPRMTLVRRSFDSATEDEVAALAQPVLALPRGGRMTIQTLAALTAIDVDGGTMGDEDAAMAHRRINLSMLPELARQIRLRNLSGAILVDFAGLSSRQRARLEAPLREALADDPLTPRLMGFTALGLAEISRRRVHAPLAEQLAGSHAAAAAALRHATGAGGVAGTELRLAPEVHAAFMEDARMRDDWQQSGAHGVEIRADARLAGTGWRLVAREPAE